MTNGFSELTLRQAGKVAGIALLLMAVLSLFANFFVGSTLVVPGDAATTVSNIMANELLFRSGNVSWLIVLALDVIVAWALYVLLKPVNKSLSLLAALFRLVYTAVHGIALLNLVLVLVLASGAEYLTVFETGQLQALVLFLLNGHSLGFTLGLVFFGIHLSLLGYLVYKSGYIPRTLGVLLGLSSLGYLIDSLANVLLPNYAEYGAIVQAVLGVPMFIGEVSLLVWLLIRGVNSTPDGISTRQRTRRSV